MPRRIYVLHATTKPFTFICAKKGNIASGMSEEIFVQFVPEAYKYHYDCLRIQAEGNNFIVPIHAYPVMSKKPRIVPKFIDLGIRELGSTLVKVCLMDFLSARTILHYIYDITDICDPFGFIDYGAGIGSARGLRVRAEHNEGT